MNLPTKITVTRLVLIPVFIAFYCMQGLWDYMYLFTWLTFVFAAVTDFADGHLARKLNLVTNLGKFLDPIADKVLVVAGLFIIVHGEYLPVPYLGLICAVIIMARELTIGLFRQLAALQNFVLAADKLGKWKTATTLVAMGFLFITPLNHLDNVFAKVLIWIGTILFVAATILTVVSGLNYIIQNKQILIDKKDDNENNIDKQ